MKTSADIYQSDRSTNELIHLSILYFTTSLMMRVGVCRGNVSLVCCSSYRRHHRHQLLPARRYTHLTSVI